jgi:D-serine deaminase-like pyridoxal phosphate-dependent protein
VIEIDELETPALLVDLDRMKRNLDKGAEYSRRHGIGLRPHIKTHKSPLLAREQLLRGATGLTCATPFEAEVMREATRDILVMYPPVGAHRARRLAKVACDARLTVALDSERAAQDLSKAAAEENVTIRVLVELDAGMHRVGVTSPAEAATLAKKIASLPNLEVAGFAFYPGHVREHVKDHAPRLRELGAFVASARRALDDAGIKGGVVSAGSTPTMWHTHDIEGVNEMRPGTYIFNDRTTAEIGACTYDDCALTVLATVVSTAVPGQAVVDAGSKALGREPMRGGPGDGFGVLASDVTVNVKSMSEEHGILDLSQSSWRPRVGERVRIVPNHVCIVVHLADLVYGVRDDAVVSSWPVAARGRGQAELADLGR